MRRSSASSSRIAWVLLLGDSNCCARSLQLRDDFCMFCPSVNLVREIVIDDPFAPGELEPVPIQREPREKAACVSISRRSGIERDPAIAGEIDLDPGVRVALADDVVAGEVVVFAGQKSGDVTRGNPHGAQHHRHRRGEIFAVAGAAHEKKIGERIVGPGAAQIERVGVMRFQVALDVRGSVVFVVRVFGDFLGEFLDARIERREAAGKDPLIASG